MSIKMNLGICKKIGLPDYGSVGAQCYLELELDSSALEHPEEFHKKVREAYVACRCAVEDELANHRNKANSDVRPTTPPKTEYRNSSSPSSERNENVFLATEKQQQLIGWLTKSVKGLTSPKLDEYCRVTFGKGMSQLSAKDASKLIDDLKAAKGGGKEIA